MTGPGVRAIRLAVLLLGLAGCAVLREPDPAAVAALAGAMAPDTASAEGRLQAMRAARALETLRRRAGIGPGDGAVPEGAQAARLAAAAALLDGGRVAPAASPHPVTPSAARVAAPASVALFLDRDGPVTPEAALALPARAAVQVALTSVTRTRLDATLRCDGPATLTLRAEWRQWLAAGQDTGFVIPARSRNRARLDLPDETQSCRLTLRPAGGAAYGVTLRRDALPAAVRALDRRQDICARPAPQPDDPLRAAFLADRWLSQTCPMPPGALRLLPDPDGAFLARAEALLGRPLPAGPWAARDPQMPLDFSAAPELDLIYVSTLHMRADLAGYLTVRMLRHHAARGTVVRIIAADAMMGARDRALIEALAADFPTVQIQYYRWSPPGPGSVAEAVASVHRVHHVKAFVTVGARPGSSRAIVGGRNLHDGFVLARPADLSALPFLHSYAAAGGLRLDFFASYDDMDIEFRGDAAARAIAAHLADFWHRDPGGAARPPAVTGTAPDALPDGPLMRHFLSVPPADGRAQEALFVELIDAARDRIVWVTPYLNPTPAIEAALRRARARGVSVTIHLRTTVDDPVGEIITALNLQMVNRFGALFEIHDQPPSDRMQHAKILLIDGRLALVMSTNLNRRSFGHDTENGVIVLDPGLVARLERITDAARARGPRLSPGQTVPPLLRWLLAVPGVRDIL